MYYIYVIISQTPTKFGKIIRIVKNLNYNHTAIAFDENLSEVYAFARQKHSVLLTGKLVQENLTRYTLNKVNCINCVIFKLPVSKTQYEKAKKLVKNILDDNEYMYNFISVLTFPLIGGVSVYKSFSCIEFAIYLLTKIGFHFSKPAYKYTPDDLCKIFKKNILFKGNLCDYWNISSNSKIDYFDHITMSDVFQSIIAIKRIFSRSFQII